MAEKRKLMAEMDRVFRKVDEGVELFEDIMQKMMEANSENQREKFQDDLKKEIKKLQRLRDQIKGWQNSNEVKDKDKLAQYRKTIENRMEQFKDIERENKTKPHSKQGLNAEEKLDPRERERSELIEFIQECLQSLNDQRDIIECDLEQHQGSKKKTGKAAKPSRAEEDLKHRLDRHKHHIQQLELVMRLLNNETLETSQVKEIKDDIEDYINRNGEDGFEENEYLYDDLNMGDAAHFLGGVTNIGTFEEPEVEGDDLSQHSGSPEPSHQRVSESSNGKRPAKVKATKSTSSASKDADSLDEAKRIISNGPEPLVPLKSQPSTPLRLTVQRSGELSPPNGGITPPVLGYAKAAASAKAPEPLLPSLPHMTSGPTPLIPPTNNHTPFSQTLRELREKSEKEAEERALVEDRVSPTKSLSSLHNGSSLSSQVPALKSIAGAAVELGGESAMLFLHQRGREQASEGTNEAMIPPILGASPLGRTPVTAEQKAALCLLDAATSRLPLPSDSERLRPYISRNPSKQPAYYAQSPPPLSDTLEYFHRLAPETLFFIFYYLEGTKAQYLAAKALKKQSWRFHKKYMMWFQRHEDPTAITDDYEQGTYVYFDFEKWSQRKKESFTFEYQYLEDRDLS